MKHQVFLVASALALAPTHARAVQAVNIELLPQVQVAGPQVTLGELARMSSSDYALLRSLVDLRVGRAPAAGASAMVEREVLAAWLRRRPGLAQARLEWKGAQASRVTSAIRTVSAEAIAEAAAVALRDWLGQRSQRSEVQIANWPRDVEAPPGHLGLRPRALGEAALRGRMTVWVEVWVAERFIRVVPVTFAVSAWGPGLAARARLEQGAPLDGSVLAYREVSLPEHGIPPPQLAVPARLRRPVAAQAVLQARDVEPVPAVVRGQWASLRSGTGAVSAEARVQVLQDGRVGDKVRVRPSAATADVLATVTGVGQLEVAR